MEDIRVSMKTDRYLQLVKAEEKVRHLEQELKDRQKIIDFVKKFIESDRKIQKQYLEFIDREEE